MKKLLAVLLTAVFALTLSACGSKAMAIEDFYEGIEKGNYTLTIEMSDETGSMEMTLKLTEGKFHLVGQVGDEFDEGFLEMTDDATYFYQQDEDGNWYKELDETGENEMLLESFNFFTEETKASLTEKKSGYYATEVEVEGTMVEVMSLDLTNGDSVVFTLFGTMTLTYTNIGSTTVTLPVILPTTPETDTETE